MHVTCNVRIERYAYIVTNQSIIICKRYCNENVLQQRLIKSRMQNVLVGFNLNHSLDSFADYVVIYVAILYLMIYLFHIKNMYILY